MNPRPGFTTAFRDEIPNFRDTDEVLSTLDVPRERVRVSGPRSAWVQELEKQFNTLTSLPKGWDGYAGVPVSFNCAQFAANLVERLCVEDVPAPQLVPGSDGTLQLEWHLNQFDLEVDVLAPYYVVATFFDHLTGEEREIEIQSDFSELADWVRALGQVRFQ
jgi:hypothetical protein